MTVTGDAERSDLLVVWTARRDRRHAQRFLPSNLTPVPFAMRGSAPVAYVVFVPLGGAVGTVLRRPLPAVAITIAVLVGVPAAILEWMADGLTVLGGLLIGFAVWWPDSSEPLTV